jgi:N-acetylmuramoyl-L-alanine amidase
VRSALAAVIAFALLAVLAACGGSGAAVRANATTDPTAGQAPGAAGAQHPAGAASAIAGATTPIGSSTTAASDPTPTPATSPAPAALRPPIHPWPIPFGRARKLQMAAYSERHYGEDTYVLSRPKVIVEHYTETTTALQAYDTFAADVPDSEFGELPNTCAHFLVEPGGRIDQLVALSVRCRHTTGLNWTAIGIENVGMSDAAILDDRAQIAASLALTRWLRCTYGIALKNVIGHNESLSSPYHHDLVAAFQHQTHSDFDHADMHVYRTRLARLACPAGSFGGSAEPGTGGT